VSSQTKKKR